MRNLYLRLAVAAIGIPLLLYLARTGSWPLRLLILALQIVTLYEWRKLWSTRNASLALPPMLMAVAGLDAAVFFWGNSQALALGVLGIAILLLSEIFRPQRVPLLQLGAGALYLIYVAAPFALWSALDALPAAVRFAPAGALVTLFIATWLCDSGAYFVGRSLGRHKLYPAASPNKTVEGLIGGIAAAAIAVPLVAALGWLQPVWLDYIAVPLIVGLLGQSGDLLESLMKREAGIKDSSTLLPGHGGLLDRFDSMLISTLFLFSYLILTA